MATRSLQLPILLACIVGLVACGNPQGLQAAEVAPTAPAERQAEVQATAAPFCLVTHFTEGGDTFYEVAQQSHRRYAARHGYAQQSFEGHISGASFLDPARGNALSLFGGGLYWQKLWAMQQVLRHGIVDVDGQMKSCAWAMWLDSDTVITNESISLEELIRPFLAATRGGMAVDVLLSEDIGHPVSGGVFFVRNSAVGLGYLDAVSALYPLYKDLLLPEQTAMATVAYLAEPWDSVHKGLVAELHPAVAVAPQRTFNSFWDYGQHFPAEILWQKGDFLLHLAGVPRPARLPILQQNFEQAIQ